MPDRSCCSCKFAQREVNETDDGNYIACSNGKEITPEMMMDSPCEEYVRLVIH